MIGSVWDVKPGDTIIVPAEVGGFEELGHKPDTVDSAGQTGTRLAQPAQ